MRWLTQGASDWKTYHHFEALFYMISCDTDVVYQDVSPNLQSFYYCYSKHSVLEKRLKSEPGYARILAVIKELVDIDVMARSDFRRFTNILLKYFVTSQPASFPRFDDCIMMVRY